MVTVPGPDMVTVPGPDMVTVPGLDMVTVPGLDTVTVYTCIIYQEGGKLYHTINPLG